jgi:hypothetical protein
MRGEEGSGWKINEQERERERENRTGGLKRRQGKRNKERERGGEGRRREKEKGISLGALTTRVQYSRPYRAESPSALPSRVPAFVVTRSL